jgi:hypothetical protein
MALAVQLAKVHGVSRTATLLGLDDHSLKKRAEAVTSESQSSDPAFGDLPAPVPVGEQCLFELDNCRRHAATGQSKYGERRPRR